MFHLAHRGQAPAKGILHGVEVRQPLKREPDANGKEQVVLDPRGYFTGQRTNPRKRARRAEIKAAGGIRQFKKQRSTPV